MLNRYKYKAKEKSGKTVRGEVEAQTKSEAAKLIKEKGLFAYSIVQSKNIFTIANYFKNRISHSDITNFTRQLAIMINAGLPITECLLILRSQSKGQMQKVVAQMLADIESGESLEKAMTKQSKYFSSTYIALIRSGEVGGVLDQVLIRLADNMESEREFRNKIKGAMIYPAIIVIGMIAAAILMIVFVIPKLLSLYSEFQAELPLPTKILMAVSNIILNYWYIVILLLVIAYFASKAYFETPRGKLNYYKLMFKIPILGELQKQVLLTDITRTLSLMVGAGVSILEAINIIANGTKNLIIKNALTDASKQIEKGFPVAYSFARHPEAFPFIMSQLMSVGEQTGKMGEVMQKVSTIFETESNEKLKALLSAIEPLIMIVLGVGVGFMVIAVILPIYNLTSQF